MSDLGWWALLCVVLLYAFICIAAWASGRYGP
jgi:hypothetical protein